MRASAEISRSLGLMLTSAIRKAKQIPELKNVSDAEQRKHLLTGAFAVSPTAIQGERILLIDDLYRSGATMSAINVQVFCSGGHCRNNLGPWKVKCVTAPHSRRDFEFFTAKDAAMAEEADVGFMLWDGQSSGTVVNAARLIAAGKPVVIYVAPEREFRTVKSRSDFEALLSHCPSEIRQRIDRYIANHAGEYTQHAMF